MSDFIPLSVNKALLYLLTTDKVKILAKKSKNYFFDIVDIFLILF